MKGLARRSSIAALILLFGAGTLGRITSQAGDPRIMQFGMKYGF